MNCLLVVVQGESTMAPHWALQWEAGGQEGSCSHPSHRAKVLWKYLWTHIVHHFYASVIHIISTRFPLELFSAHSCLPIVYKVEINECILGRRGDVFILYSCSKMRFGLALCFSWGISPCSFSELGLRKWREGCARMCRISWGCSPAASGVPRLRTSAWLWSPGNAWAPGLCSGPFPWRLLLRFYIFNR